MLPTGWKKVMMTLQHCAFAIAPDLPPNVPISNAKHPSITPASAKCSCARMQAGAGKSEGKAAQMEPGGRSAALSVLSGCSCVRMQAGCTEGNRLRLQAVAVPERAKPWLCKCSPAGRSAALSAERNAAECVSRLAAARATDCECGLLPCPSERSTAAVTKPFRAGVQRLQG